MNRLKEKFKRVDYGPQSADWGKQELQSLFTAYTFSVCWHFKCLFY